MQCCPKSTKTTMNRIFSVQSCLELLKQHRQDCMEHFTCVMLFYLCNDVPRVTGFFSLQCCLELPGQHCTRFLPVQCCRKSIKTTLNRAFSCSMLSGASWTTFHKVFVYLYNVVPRLLRQH